MLLFGRAYIEAATVVRILSVAQIFVVAAGPIQSLYGAYMANWARFYVTVLVAPAALLASAVLSMHIGLPGAAIGTTLGFASLFAVLLLYARRKFGMHAVNILRACFPAA